MTPERSYLICSTPRSGSTLLCHALASTGVAGHPAEHFEVLLETGNPRQPRDYFQRSNDPEVWEMLDDPAYDAILGPAGGWYAPQPKPLITPKAPDFQSLFAQAIADGTTPNGIFGTKLMWIYFRDFVRLARRDGRHTTPPCEVACEIFPNLSQYIFLRREDTLKQAISLWKALQTWQWRRGEDEAQIAHDLRYNRAAIRHLKSRIEEHNSAWTSFFACCNITPTNVVYEAFIEDYAGTTRRLLTAIGVEGAEAVAIAAPRMKQQADTLSKAWVERYLDEEDAC